jgi:sec-independent protein translocase protein TatA
MVVPSSSLAFLDILSGPELIVVLAVVLIFFGGEKMPEFARGLGKVMREFKKAAGDVEREFKRVIDEAEHPPAPTPTPALTIAPPEHLPEAYEQHYDCPEDAAHVPPPEATPSPEHPEKPLEPAPEVPPNTNRLSPEPPSTPEI